MNKNPTRTTVPEEQENVLFGLVGAFLFSLAGGIIYFLLLQIGYIAAISGLIGVVCAIKGYSFFAKKESMKGVILSVIIAVIVLIIAWYFGFAYQLYQAYQDWYALGEVEYTLTFFESVRAAIFFIPDNLSHLGDLGISLLLAAVGCGSYVANSIKRAKAANCPCKSQAEQAVDELPAQQEYTVPEESQEAVDKVEDPAQEEQAEAPESEKSEQ